MRRNQRRNAQRIAGGVELRHSGAHEVMHELRSAAQNAGELSAEKRRKALKCAEMRRNAQKSAQKCAAHRRSVELRHSNAHDIDAWVERVPRRMQACKPRTCRVVNLKRGGKG